MRGSRGARQQEVKSELPPRGSVKDQSKLIKIVAALCENAARFDVRRHGTFRFVVPHFHKMRLHIFLKCSTASLKDRLQMSDEQVLRDVASNDRLVLRQSIGVS